MKFFALLAAATAISLQDMEDNQALVQEDLDNELDLEFAPDMDDDQEDEDALLDEDEEHKHHHHHHSLFHHAKKAAEFGWKHRKEIEAGAKKAYKMYNDHKKASAAAKKKWETN